MSCLPSIVVWINEAARPQYSYDDRYSAFFETDLESRLSAANPDKVIICGVCTDICVMHTAYDARDRDYTVEVPTDCVASFDPRAHAYALEHMEKILGAKLIGSAPIVAPQ